MSWRTPPAAIADSEVTKEYTADVVVIGLGNSGAPAFRAAAEAGAEVIGLEAMPEKGYNTFGRQIGHINSEFLAKFGVDKVDPNEFFLEWMRRSGGRANQKLIMQFAKKSGAAIDWLFSVLTPEQYDKLSVTFWPLGKNFSGELSGYKFWGACAEISGGITVGEVMRANIEKGVSLGGTALFGTRAVQLIVEEGRVTGVFASDRKDTIRINAKKGVILAAGDFGGDKEMCEELIVDAADMMDTENDKFFSLGRDGSGIKMGVWAGGRLEPRPLPAMGGNYMTPLGVTGIHGGLWLDENGERWCNEGLGDPVFAGFAAANEKHMTKYVIFDSSILEDLEAGTPAHCAFELHAPGMEETLVSQMKEAYEAGDAGAKVAGFRLGESSMLYAADSLEELGRRLGFEGERLESFLGSIRRYNDFCYNGRDDDFAKDKSLLNPVDEPPYFAQPSALDRVIGGSLVTVGGFLTDERQNVLDKDKDPIPGLYATGNCCGRRFGLQYSTPIAGVSIGIAVTLGRECGSIAAGAEG